jgi:hypothetical protein
MCSADHGSNDADNTPLRRFMSDRDSRILSDAYGPEVRRYLAAKLQLSPHHPDIDDGVRGTFDISFRYLTDRLAKRRNDELLAMEESFLQWLYKKADMVVLWKHRLLAKHPIFGEDFQKRLYWKIYWLFKKASLNMAQEDGISSPGRVTVS